MEKVFDLGHRLAAAILVIAILVVSAVGYDTEPGATMLYVGIGALIALFVFHVLSKTCARDCDEDVVDALELLDPLDND